MGWRDVSSYSRGDAQRIPVSWALEVGDLEIVITRRHGLTGWFLDCDPFFSYKQLADEDVDAAKRVAVILVKERLLNAIKALDRSANV